MVSKKGHEYELVLYKENQKEVSLKSYEIGDDVFLRMQFESDHQLSKNDLIWAQNDMDTGNTDLMLMVVKNYGNNKVQVKTPGNIYVKDLRQFSKNEIFKLIATYKRK